MDLNLQNEINQTKEKENNIDDFTHELKNALANDKDTKEYNYIDLSERYKNYWEDKLDYLEYDVASTIGLTRFNMENLHDYGDRPLEKIINDSIFEIAKREGVTLYKTSYSYNITECSVDIYEKNRKTVKHDKITMNKELDDNTIFQYDNKGKMLIRNDLKEEIIKLACEKSMKFKEEQDKESEEFKVEGELYEAFSGNGYVFLENKEGDRIEDIDFSNDVYSGEGIYKVENGKYVKLEDEIYREEFEKNSTRDEKYKDYSINKRTNTFHLYDKNCSTIKNVEPQYIQEITASQEELVDEGFKPCKKCNN